MTITLLEQTLIDNARTHQEALAAHYPKHQAGQSNDDSEYLMHSGALTDLVSLTHHKSGLSEEAAELLRQIEAENIATFKLHFPVDAPPREGIRPVDTRKVDIARAVIQGSSPDTHFLVTEDVSFLDLKLPSQDK